MNEQIQELAIMANPSSKEIYEADNWQYNCAAWDSNNLTKFAQLIVEECVSIGDNYQDILGYEPECFNCRKVAYGIVDKIKQHFGVEL